MASLTRLRRRLLEWERYAARVKHQLGMRWITRPGGASSGHDRLAIRVFDEVARREARAARDPWGVR